MSHVLVVTLVTESHSSQETRTTGDAKKNTETAATATAAAAPPRETAACVRSAFRAFRPTSRDEMGDSPRRTKWCAFCKIPSVVIYSRRNCALGACVPGSGLPGGRRGCTNPGPMFSVSRVLGREINTGRSSCPVPSEFAGKEGIDRSRAWRGAGSPDRSIPRRKTSLLSGRGPFFPTSPFGGRS